MRWIGRLRMVTAAQVGDRFAVGRAVSYARLGGLVELGLLNHLRIFHATPGVYTATKVGLAAVDLDLPPARVDVRTYEHDLTLSSLVTDLEREVGSESVCTEREIRARDTPLHGQLADGLQFAVPIVDLQGHLRAVPTDHQRLHYPDCVLTTGRQDDASTAIELERTAKGRKRLGRILSAYVAAHHIGEVRYFPTSAKVKTLVEEEVTKLRAQGLVKIDDRLVGTTPHVRPTVSEAAA